MRKNLIIILSVLALGTAAYYIYDTQIAVEKVDHWELVPESSILVYETKDLITNWNSISEQPIWKTLSETPAFEKINSSLLQLDSLTGKDGRLNKLFHKNSFLASLHVVSRDSFDYLFYLKLRSPGDIKLIKNILADFQELGSETTNYTYEDFIIQEIRTGEQKFSYLIYKDYVICSFNSLLVEDVIRTLSGKANSNFKKEMIDVFDLTKIENDEGNIYVNINKVSQLLNTFSNFNPDLLKDLQNFSDATFLDLRVLPNSLLLNGFTVEKPEHTDQYLSAYHSLKPGESELVHYLSNRTAIAYYYFLHDPAKWSRKVGAFWNRYNPVRNQKLASMASKIDFNFQSIYDWLGDEMALALIEPVGNKDPDRLVFFKATDIHQGINSMNRMAESIYISSEDTLYREVYGTYPITQLPLEEFPSTIFGAVFEGFPTCYFTAYENTIILGSSVQALKTQLDDLENENIWGKSVKMNLFLENHTVQEANVSVLINTARSWNYLMQQMNEKWSAYFNENEKVFKRMDMISLQFSSVGDKNYTSLAINHKDTPIQDPQESRFRDMQYTRLDSRVLTKPFVVRNHRNGSREVFLQDSSFHVQLVDSKGKILWEDSLGERMTSKLIQVDYFNNDKLQYFFATETGIHILDREGKPVENFPLRMKGDRKIRNANIIDYDNSKNYRINVIDQDGKIYLYNKTGQLLKGWDPLVLPGLQHIPVRHIRVRNKDCMIIQKENGKLYVTNRRGEPYNGFPVDLKARLLSPVFIEMGTGFSNTLLTSITQDGEIISVNLYGKVISRKQLIKPSRETIYTLVPDELGKTFIVAQQELNRLSVLDREGNLKFEKGYLTSEALDLQYYNFNSDTEVIAINDSDQEFTYLYDGAGNLYNSDPLESSFDIALMFFENDEQFRLYSVYENRLAVQQFSK